MHTWRTFVKWNIIVLLDSCSSFMSTSTNFILKIINCQNPNKCCMHGGVASLWQHSLIKQSTLLQRIPLIFWRIAMEMWSLYNASEYLEHWTHTSSVDTSVLTRIASAVAKIYHDTFVWLPAGLVFISLGWGNLFWIPRGRAWSGGSCGPGWPMPQIRR